MGMHHFTDDDAFYDTLNDYNDHVDRVNKNDTPTNRRQLAEIGKDLMRRYRDRIRDPNIIYTGNNKTAIVEISEADVLRPLKYGEAATDSGNTSMPNLVQVTINCCCSCCGAKISESHTLEADKREQFVSNRLKGWRADDKGNFYCPRCP